MAAKPEQQAEEGDHELGIVFFPNYLFHIIVFLIIQAHKNLQGSKTL